MKIAKPIFNPYLGTRSAASSRSLRVVEKFKDPPMNVESLHLEEPDS